MRFVALLADGVRGVRRAPTTRRSRPTRPPNAGKQGRRRARRRGRQRRDHPRQRARGAHGAGARRGRSRSPIPRSASAGSRKLTSQVLDEMVNEELIVQAAEAAKIEVESQRGPGRARRDQAAEQPRRRRPRAGARRAGLHDGELQAPTCAASCSGSARSTSSSRPRSTSPTRTSARATTRCSAAPSAVSAVQLSHILIKLPEHPTEQQIAEAKDKAAQGDRAGQGRRGLRQGRGDDVRRRRHEGAPGGELGWFQRGSMPTPSGSRSCSRWRRATSAARSTGPQGLHVFQVTEVKKHRAQAVRRDEGAAPARAAPPRDGQADADLGRGAAQEGVHRHQAAVASSRRSGRCDLR